MGWLDARGPEWKAAVRVVAIDPSAGWRAAVERALPHASVVVDHFHLVRLANQTVTEVRQRDPRGPPPPRSAHRPGVGTPPAVAARRRAAQRALRRLVTVFETRRPDQRDRRRLGVKEWLRQLLAARSRHTITSRLHRFSHEAVVLADLTETSRLAETVDPWWPEILGFLETGITNAATEGTDRLIKDATRTASAFAISTNQRRRVRFHCTRQSRDRQRRGGPAPSRV